MADYLIINKNTSWQISGSGVYAGFSWCLIYYVQQKTLWAKAFKNSLWLKIPWVGFIIKPVSCFNKLLRSCLIKYILLAMEYYFLTFHIFPLVY